jgi:hypothetical protein
MSVETVATGITYRVQTEKGEWFHVEATFDAEWGTWTASVTIWDRDAKTPEEALAAVAGSAERLAASLKARTP